MYNFEEDILNSSSFMGDYMECPIHWLVTDDHYYRQFQARLEDPNKRDMEGNTLLHVASQSPMDNSRTVQLLIKRGADVNSTNPYGHTPLHFAVASRKHYAVVALLEAKASVNSKDLLGRTALHFSVCKGEFYRLDPVPLIECDMWVVERLLCHTNTCLNSVDLLGETPLLWAVKEQNSYAVRALLKKGANPDIPRIGDNQTALHEALYAMNPRINIVSALLVHGAGLYCEDFSRNTAMDIMIHNVSIDCKMRQFTKYALMVIAFRYHIKDCLWSKLEGLPDLYMYLKECCKEVSLMKKLIVYDNVTLHDFSLNCFQTRVRDPVVEIYEPVVHMLLSEFFSIYFDVIFYHLPKTVLRSVLEKAVGRAGALDMVPNGASKYSIFYLIHRVCHCKKELKDLLTQIKIIIINLTHHIS